MNKRNELIDGVPCSHPGCLCHISHPCEGCGRVGGKYVNPPTCPMCGKEALDEKQQPQSGTHCYSIKYHCGASLVFAIGRESKGYSVEMKCGEKEQPDYGRLAKMGGNHLIRLGKYDINMILPELEDGHGRAKKYIELDGELVKTTSDRYPVFKKSLSCAVCGVRGAFFAAERHRVDKKYHFNLYAVDDNGDEILMTKDHIIPRARGGANYIDNYQTMCTLCNHEKADKI